MLRKEKYYYNLNIKELFKITVQQKTLVFYSSYVVTFVSVKLSFFVFEWSRQIGKIGWKICSPLDLYTSSRIQLYYRVADPDPPSRIRIDKKTHFNLALAGFLNSKV